MIRVITTFPSLNAWPPKLCFQIAKSSPRGALSRGACITRTPVLKRISWQFMLGPLWLRRIEFSLPRRQRENFPARIFGVCVRDSTGPSLSLSFVTLELSNTGGLTMEDNKLAVEEARRAGQHGSVKSQIKGEVQAEIA